MQDLEGTAVHAISSGPMDGSLDGSKMVQYLGTGPQVMQDAKLIEYLGQGSISNMALLDKLEAKIQKSGHAPPSNPQQHALELLQTALSDIRHKSRQLRKDEK